MREIPADDLAKVVQSNVALSVSSRGLRVPVAKQTALVLALQGAQELEIEYEASGILLLTFLTVDPSTHALPDHRGPPYRYLRVRPGRGRVSLDLLSTAHWSRAGLPYLLLEGAGSLTITGLRYRTSPADSTSNRAALDRAVFWAPFSVGYTTINLLDPAFWSFTAKTFLFDRLGIAFLALTAVLVLSYLLARRGFQPGKSVAFAALLVAGPANLLFLAKLVPAASLSVRLDPEDRIRENYAYAPKLGALASLARATLRADERVGVRGNGTDWFAPEALCFNLAPRRCATVVPGAPEYSGLSRVDRLRPDEIDAIVSIDTDEPLPEGFVKVAEVSGNAFVARRR